MDTSFSYNLNPDTELDFLRAKYYSKRESHYLEAFELYLKEIFRQFSSFFPANNVHGVVQTSFFKLLTNIPVPLSEKIFKRIDIGDNEFLGYEEFSKFFIKLVSSEYIVCSKIIFDILDSNQRGYIPLRNIDIVCYLCFKEKTQFYQNEFIKFSDFIDLKQASTNCYFSLAILEYFYENMPILTHNLSIYLEKVQQKYKSYTPNTSKEIISISKKVNFNLGGSGFGSAKQLKNVDYPEIQSRSRFSLDNEVCLKNPKAKKFSHQCEDLKSVIKLSKINSAESLETPNSSKSKDYSTPNLSSYFFISNPDSNKLSTKFILVNNLELFIYDKTNVEKTMFLEAVDIANALVKSDKSIILDDSEYFGLRIICRCLKVVNLYSPDKNLVSDWITELRKLIGHKNFFDYCRPNTIISKGKSIYQATLCANGEKVAVKIVSKSLEEISKNLSINIDNEVMINKLIASEENDSFATFKGFFENSEYYFIVVEHFNDSSLGNFISRNEFFINGKTFSENAIVEIAFLIAKALNILHERGIVYRNLNLDTIMIKQLQLTSENDELSIKLKLTDFGNSLVSFTKEKLSEPYKALYRDYINYLAPEYFSEKVYDYKVDVWSFGVLLFYLVTGTFPFRDDKSELDESIIRKCVFGTYKFPEMTQINKNLKALIEKCLQVEPSKRPKFKDIIKDKVFANKYD